MQLLHLEQRARVTRKRPGQRQRFGVAAERLVPDIFAADAVLHQLRKVQAVVRLLTDGPPEQAERAARRARAYGRRDHCGIKNTLVQALDLEPLPSNT